MSTRLLPPDSARRYAILCLAIARMGCFSNQSTLAVGLGIDAIWCSATLYAALRVTLHACQIRRPVEEFHGLPLEDRRLWSRVALDKACFPLHFGVVGSFPWRSRPSETIALNSFQAMLFFQLYSLTEWAVVLLFGTPASAPYTYLLDEMAPAYLRALKILLVLAWSTYILPRLVIAFALPPFVAEEEEKRLGDLLVQAIQKKKKGRGSLRATLNAASTNGATRRSLPASSGMAGYFVGKAASAGGAAQALV
mmetsp:Transcript_34954/g.91771  ORF Transcript_34954/g.91771 Transcript_34954/m.91771 type:complete len:252 (-) Transcript_34954:525-1280(-)